MRFRRRENHKVCKEPFSPPFLMIDEQQLTPNSTLPSELRQQNSTLYMAVRVPLMVNVLPMCVMVVSVLMEEPTQPCFLHVT
jgi:hypothetical protein